MTTEKETNENYLTCAYCGKKRPPEEMEQRTIISRMYKNYESEPKNYCKGTGCGGYHQMGHEG